MTIIESLVRLRDDLKTWAANNLFVLDKRTRNLHDDGSGALNVTDEKGNIIFRVDKDGVKTTAVEAQSMTLNGQDVGDLKGAGDYNELENAPAIDDDGSDELTVTDPDGNIILRVDKAGVKTTAVEAKTMRVDGMDVSDLKGAGDYNELENAPAIDDNGSNELTVTDPDGYVVMLVDKDGIDTVGLKINGVEISSYIAALCEKFFEEK